MTQPPDRGPDDFERVQLVLEDARERARQIIDQSVAEAQDLLNRRPPREDANVHRALATLTDEVRDLRHRLDRIETLLRRQEPPVAARESAPAPQAAPPLQPASPAASIPSPPPSPPAAPSPMPVSSAEPVRAAPAPAPPAEAPEPATHRLTPEDGPVTVLVSPVAGFQGLMRVQEALVHIDAIAEAIVEGYAQGEARLRLQLREAITLGTLSSGLSAALAQRADVQPSADDERTLRVSLS